MNLLFINLSSLRFTAATVDHAPLGGSESALCYLARALAERGHAVSLIANLPDGIAAQTLIAGVRHFQVATLKDAAFYAAASFDAIILCNAPVAAPPLRPLSPASHFIYWAHVQPHQPSMQVLAQAEVRQALDATVFVSDWQKNLVESAFGPMAEACVIGNGIAPAFENMFASPDDVRRAKQNRAVYATIPERGLSVLLRAMRGLDRPTGLDLFSSMQLYQGGDAAFAALFDEAAQNPAIASHGAVAQSVLAQQMRRAAFLFYPCLSPETFCITAAEALAAGMKLVATDTGALAETTMGYADLVPVAGQNGDALVRDYRVAMRHAIDDFSQTADWAEHRFAQSKHISATYAWSARAAQWERMLFPLS